MLKMYVLGTNMSEWESKDITRTNQLLTGASSSSPWSLCELVGAASPAVVDTSPSTNADFMTTSRDRPVRSGGGSVGLRSPAAESRDCDVIVPFICDVTSGWPAAAPLLTVPESADAARLECDITVIDDFAHSECIHSASISSIVCPVQHTTHAHIIIVEYSGICWKLLCSGDLSVVSNSADLLITYRTLKSHYWPMTDIVSSSNAVNSLLMVQNILCIFSKSCWRFLLNIYHKLSEWLWLVGYNDTTAQCTYEHGASYGHTGHIANNNQFFGKQVDILYHLVLDVIHCENELNSHK